MSIKNNTTVLQEILETINALPEAGSVELPDPEISVDSTTGLITATAGTKSATHQLAFQEAKTITPSTVDQIAVSSGHYTGGDVIVDGDSNLISENIKSGVSIFGVSGTLENTGLSLPGLSNPGSASDLLSGKELIDGEGNVVTGTIETKTSDDLSVTGPTVTVPAGYYPSQSTKSIPTVELAVPSIMMPEPNGLIRATVAQKRGYVSTDITSATMQLDLHFGKTITPSTVDQVAVPSIHFTQGDTIVEGDENLLPENIKSGVSIFGVNGTLEQTVGVDIPELTNPAESSEVFSGTEYIDAEGNKQTGTFSIDEELSTQDDLIAQIQSVLDGKIGGVKLPFLSNPGTAENLQEGYELIDGDGNIVVGTHVCSGGGDGENITFHVVNSLPDMISVYGKNCPPNETTTVCAPVDASFCSGMPIAIWTGLMDGELRDYYNNYSVYLSYPMEGEDGEFYNEIFGVAMKSQDNYPFCALGITEVNPYDGECFTIYCEEV